MTRIALVAALAACAGSAQAQRIADYDPALTPYPAESLEFCMEAPSCYRLVEVAERDSE